MFKNATSFNKQIKQDVIVTYYDEETKSLNSDANSGFRRINLLAWNTNKVTDYTDMFSGSGLINSGYSSTPTIDDFSPLFTINNANFFKVDLKNILIYIR